MTREDHNNGQMAGNRSLRDKAMVRGSPLDFPGTSIARNEKEHELVEKEVRRRGRKLLK